MTQASEEISRQFADGGINRRTWGTLIFNIKPSAAGDGITDDTASLNNTVAAAAASGGIVGLSPGTYRIRSNVTIPSNVTLWFANGAKLSLDSGVSITLNGTHIDAGPYQIFSGNGTVLGNVKIAKVYPQWWGAKGDNSTQDAWAIQKAITFIQQGAGGSVEFPKASYIIESTLTINYAGSYGLVNLVGNNCQFKYIPTSGAFIRINPTTTDSDAGDGRGISYFSIRDFGVDSYGTTSTHIGIDIGTEGYNVDAFAYCQVENVTLFGFDQGIHIISSRHITFKDVVVKNPISKAVHLQSAGTFCGDINFIDCEFISGKDCAVKLYAFGTNNGQGELRGVRFTDCVIYGFSLAPETVSFESSGYGRVLDIWFNHCALDQGQNKAFTCTIQENASFGFISIQHCYVVGFTQAFDFLNTSTQTNSGILVNGCTIGTTPFPFNMFNMSNLSFENNIFENVATKSAFTGSGKNIKMMGNTMRNSSFLGGQCVTLGPDIKSAIITNNFGNFNSSSTFLENQTTLPATKLVNTNNLQIEI